jgi:hypothetical protein
MFVNAQTSAELVEIDPPTDMITRRMSVPKANGTERQFTYGKMARSWRRSHEVFVDSCGPTNYRASAVQSGRSER